MFAEWYKPGCLLEYPLHGSGAVIDALVRGMQKFGGRLALGSHVEEIVIENGRATGVRLSNGLVSKIIIKNVIPNSFTILELSEWFNKLIVIGLFCSLYVPEKLWLAMRLCGIL